MVNFIYKVLVCMLLSIGMYQLSIPATLQAGLLLIVCPILDYVNDQRVFSIAVSLHAALNREDESSNLS